ncbi:DUF3024 domain-containing protein [Paenibacillus sp. 1P07SE]|uniref:DUF3024 domain-containing protein n=1 Tax=Paenibacillus sp. 1P07SE TaxID=3132209 RepID=UPI0039A56C6C
MTIAQFRYVESKWEVYWKDSKDKWNFVEYIKPIEDLEKQLRTIDKNEYGYMWM